MTTIYLAARFSRFDELNQYRDELRDRGHIVRARWLDGGHEWSGVPDEDIPPESVVRFAHEDIEDINDAEVVICFTEPARSGPARGGRHFEAGYAYRAGKRIIVVGHRENVFYTLPDITFVTDWDSALMELEAGS